MTNLPLDATKLEQLITQCKHLNIFPVFLSRYYPKTSRHPVSELLEQLVKEATDFLAAMTEGEVNILTDELPSRIKMYLDSSSGLSTVGRSPERIALYYVAAQVDKTFWSLKEVVTGDLAESKVLKRFPELSHRLDNDGLLLLDDITSAFDGGIEYKGHILQFHQFFRRGFQSNLNFNFLGHFLQYYRETKGTNQFRIALDLDRYTPATLYEQAIEKDVWYGPRFDPKKLDDRNAIGLTILKRIKPSLFDLIAKLDRTEFYWSYKNGIKTLEIEELSYRDLLFDSYSINRYAHTERNVQTQKLVHFDGAAKVYLKDTYPQRMQSNFPREPRAYKKIKLFRVDGDIHIDEWTTLLAQKAKRCQEPFRGAWRAGSFLGSALLPAPHRSSHFTPR